MVAISGTNFGASTSLSGTYQIVIGAASARGQSVTLTARDPTWIDPHCAHRIINAYVLACFGRHLTNRPSTLLTRPLAPFAEVMLTRKDAGGR